MRAGMCEAMAVAAGLLAVACQRGAPPPETLRPAEDACAQCRMAVSQPRFASQIARGRGVAPEFFDDLGCLLHRLRERPLEGPSAVYVADFDSQRWLEARAAWYVRAPSVQTPMGSGLLAFQSRGAAEAAAARHGGRVLSWSELNEPPAAAASEPGARTGHPASPAGATAAPRR